MKLRTNHHKPSERDLALVSAICTPVTMEHYVSLAPDARRELCERMPLESLTVLITIAATMRAIICDAMGAPTTGGHIFTREDLHRGLEAAIAAPIVIAGLPGKERS